MSSPDSKISKHQLEKVIMNIALKVFYAAFNIALGLFFIIVIIINDEVLKFTNAAQTSPNAYSIETTIIGIIKTYGHVIKSKLVGSYKYREADPPTPSLSEMEGGICFELDGRTLDIPKAYLAGALSNRGIIYNPDIISQILNRGTETKKVRIRIDDDSFLKYYPKPNENISFDNDNQRIYLEWLDEKTKTQYLDSKLHIYSDAWYGVNTLNNPKVKYLEQWNIFRVHQKTTLDSLIYWPEMDLSKESLPKYSKKLIIPWTALKIAPQSLTNIPNDPFEYWLANCQFRQVNYSKRTSNCQSWFIDDSLLVEFDIKDVNLDKIDAIKQTIKAHLNEWSRPCTPSYLNLEQNKKHIHPNAVESNS